ncbi:hypothetical protein BJX99DRAFT_128965 [Aspergillus californicus]
MATVNILPTTPLPAPRSNTTTTTTPSPAPNTIKTLGPNSTAVSLPSAPAAPFPAIRALFDHLYHNAGDAAALNATYPRRGILKTAATYKTAADQKFTIDLSPSRADLIPDVLRENLGRRGLGDVLGFFNAVSGEYVRAILDSLSVLAGADLSAAHRDLNVNFRLCDYNPSTADPGSENGCGAHTDYGTFSIIFQDGTAGLELEDVEKPGTWVPIPGDATVVLTGWCAVILSGGCISAARHRVRRVPGVRRLSAILFVAPDLDVKLKPLEGVQPARPLSDAILRGDLDVESFKEEMGKRWRYREGNEEMEGGETVTQDTEIEKMVWA